MNSQPSFDCLTENGRSHFDSAVKEYANKLYAEAKSIEEVEHAGHGLPEITAAHIEEAKWVTIRRLRRTVRYKGFLITVRISQFIAAALAGVGGSNVKEIWGTIILILGIAIGAASFIVEREITGGE